MRRFAIGTEIIADDDARLQQVLGQAWTSKLRPRCLCRDPGVPMYVARIDGQYLVKRMPLTGGDHDPSCESHEPPYELSGLGPLIGNAIQIDPKSGMAALKLEFSLTKTGSRAAPGAPTLSAADSVRAEQKKLTLRALLHHLWHEGGLTEWTANWQGKRHWWHVRNHLIEAARTMTVRGGPFSHLLFVPEPFRLEDKAAIEQRRTQAMSYLAPQKSGPRKLMVLVGEVKDFEEARTGRKLVIKHMPGFIILLDDGTWKRVEKRFENELSLAASNRDWHLIAIATFGLNPAGLAIIEEIALMIVAENWVPFDSLYEQRLVAALSALREKSVKWLRYNLSAETPTVTATLSERTNKAALFVVPPGVNDDFEEKLGEMAAALSDMQQWVWRVAEGDMPPLPRR